MIDREILRGAIKKASDALEAYWTAEDEIENLAGTEIGDLRDRIEPWAVISSEIDDEALDEFIADVNELLETPE